MFFSRYRNWGFFNPCFCLGVIVLHVFDFELVVIPVFYDHYAAVF